MLGTLTKLTLYPMKRLILAAKTQLEDMSRRVLGLEHAPPVLAGPLRPQVAQMSAPPG